jgi:predicted GNAT family acetyltransferase
VSVDVRHEPERRRFVAVVAAPASTLAYAPAGEGTVDFTSTFVDPSVRNRGIGEALVRTAVEWARANGFRIVPSCWFVGVWLEREAAQEARRAARGADARKSEGT